MIAALLSWCIARSMFVKLESCSQRKMTELSYGYVVFGGTLSI